MSEDTPRADPYAYPPMRYSADPTDIVGYANFIRYRDRYGCAPTVYLDGQLVSDVRSADEVLGVIVKLVRPFHVERESGDEATVEMRGRVEVRWSKPKPGTLQNGS